MADSQRYAAVAQQAMRTIRERILQIQKVDMARRLGDALGRPIGQADIGRWESGVRMPGADVLAAYLDLAYIDLSEEGLLNPDNVSRQMNLRLAAVERHLGMDGDVPLTALQTRRLEGRPDAIGDPSQYIGIEGAAKRKGVTRTSVDNWIDEGRLPAYRSYKQLVVKLSELDAIEPRRPRADA